MSNKFDSAIFASDAKKAELDDFPDIERGWGVTIDQTNKKPPMSWMNAAFNRVDKNINEIVSAGVIEWMNDYTYKKGSLAKDGAGSIYISLKDENAGNKLSSANHWQLYDDNVYNRMKDYTDEAVAALGGNFADALDEHEKSTDKTQLAVDKLNKYGTAIIGELITWGHSKMPNELFPDCEMEFLPFAGQTFDKVKYPLLGLVYPSGVLINAKDRFIRNIGDNRKILTVQEDLTGYHTHDLYFAYGTTTETINTLGATINSDKIPLKNMRDGVLVKTVKGSGSSYMITNATTGEETRPKNVSFNFIVRAK